MILEIIISLLILAAIAAAIWYMFFRYPLSSQAKQNGWTRQNRDALVKTINSKIGAIETLFNVDSSKNTCDTYCIVDVLIRYIPYDPTIANASNIILTLGGLITKYNINISDLKSCCKTN